MKVALLPLVTSPDGTENAIVVDGTGNAKRTNLLAWATAQLASAKTAALSAITAAQTTAVNAVTAAQTTATTAINALIGATGLLVSYWGFRFGVLGVYMSGRTCEKVCAATGQNAPSVLGTLVQAVVKKK